MVRLASTSRIAELTPDRAAYWIDAVLAEATLLRQYDDQWLSRKGSPETEAAAEELQAEWTRWANEAEELLDLLRPIHRSAPLHRFMELFDTIGRTRAKLSAFSMRPSDDDDAVLIPHEEVRREFLERLEAHRAATVQKAGHRSTGSGF